MNTHRYQARWTPTALLPAAGLAMLLAPLMSHAKPSGLKARYDAATSVLTLQAKSRDAEVVLYDDVLDQEIGRLAPVGGKVKLELRRLPTIPCRIRAEGGGKATATSTKGIVCKGANKPPQCKITRPVGTQSINNDGSVSFEGTVKGARSRSLNFEWDFGGGAGSRISQVAAASNTSRTGPIRFDMLHDVQLWVSFTASDITGTRCADRMAITVGSPPTPPAPVSEQPDPGTADAGDGEIKGVAEDYPDASPQRRPVARLRAGQLGLAPPQRSTEPYRALD
jgi:hypothetical protein